MASRDEIAALVLLASLPMLGCREAKREDPTVLPPREMYDAMELRANADRSPSPPISFRRSFELSTVHLSVEDVHLTRDLADVLSRTSAKMVINGGFFGLEGEPLGLAISDGKKLSAFSPTMSGGVLAIARGSAQLTATEGYLTSDVDFAIQCRPRLVVAKQVNIRKDDGKTAARTAICLRNGGTVIEIDIASDARGDGPTLFALATALAKDGCEDALNLDGGPSTGWASRDGEKLTSEPPLGPVRHVVVVR